jgi:beta-lactamase class A
LPGESWSLRSADTGLQTHRRNKLQPETARTSNTRDYQKVKGKHKNLTNRNQDYLASKPSIPTTVSPGYSNTLEKQDSDLKSYFMMLIEDFKKDINNSLLKI